MANHTSTTSLRTYARIAGLFYLVIFITAGFSEGYVRSSLIVPGDATTTAANIMASQGLYRLGFAADLIAFASDVVVSILLYILLKPVSKTIAMIATAFRLLAHPAIATVNLLNMYIATQLVGSEYLSVFNPGQLNALTLLFVNLHKTGYLIGGAFFAFHCLLLGYLLYKSDYFPRILGVLITIASFGYMLESFGNFIAPQHEAFYAWIVLVPAVVSELSLALWLLIKGVRSHPGAVKIS